MVRLETKYEMRNANAINVTKYKNFVHPNCNRRSATSNLMYHLNSNHKIYLKIYI